MDRVRKISMDILEQHRSLFDVNFSDNKEVLGGISIVRSKGLKNEIAGFITKFIKHEIREQEEKERRERQFDQQVLENKAASEAKAAEAAAGTGEGMADGADAIPAESSASPVADEVIVDTAEAALDSTDSAIPAESSPSPVADEVIVDTADAASDGTDAPNARPAGENPGQ